MSGYQLAPEAVDDLINVQEFVSADSPRAADKVIEDCFSAFEHLARWPRAGHTRRDLTDKDVLFWPVASYLIVYRVRDASPMVQIIAVLHGARDVPAVLVRR